MTHVLPASLSDRDLLDATTLAADRERRTTAELLALLAELDTRKLYLREGFSSLFTYCTQALHLSESAAYSRITAARTARRFPVILTLLSDGVATLTTVGLLAAHLTDDNHETLLDAARHKSKREIERLVAVIDPQPDIPSSVRTVWASAPANGPAPLAFGESSIIEPTCSAPVLLETRQVGTAAQVTVPPSRSFVAPLAPERYLLKVTIGREAHEKLERARALLRHANPSGDLAAVVERAVTVLVEQLERRRLATRSHRRRRTEAKRVSRASHTRYVPASIKRDVWTRDEGRCAFIGAQGRCTETSFLELHHVQPFAAGGATDTDNLQLRCRAHNAHEAACYFGEPRMASFETGPKRTVGMA